MTNKQKMFCDSYMLTLNATEAYMKVYNCSTEKSAEAASSRLLSKPDIKNYINQQVNSIHTVNIAKVEEVLETFTEILKNKHNKNSDRLKAGELLGKYYQIFTEKIDMNLSGGITIIDDIGDDQNDNNKS